MKTLKVSIFIIVLSVISCRPDREEFRFNSSVSHVSNIVGFVVDEFDAPIEGATVDFNGDMTTTDQFGSYKLSNVRVDEKHNVLVIAKQGYFNGYRTFRTHKPTTLNQFTRLIPENYDHTFAATQANTIVATKVNLDIDANAIVDAATGESYSGNVSMAVNYISPYDVARMPGDLSAIDENNELLALQSLGMVQVEMRGSSGQQLQMKEGTPAALSIEIPDNLLGSAPSQVPMWHFDEDLGLWIEEGVAMRNGNVYEADLPHFSSWNVDIPSNAASLSAVIVDKDGVPLSGKVIGLNRDTESPGPSAVTASDGSITLLVPKGRELTMHLVDPYCPIPVGPDDKLEIGSLNGNRDLGEVEFIMPETHSFKLTGELLNCDGQPLEDAIITVNGRPYYIKDGVCNTPIQYCGTKPDQIAFQIIDRNTLRAVEGEIDLTSDEVDLGEVRTCMELEEFFTIECPNIQLATVFTEVTHNGTDEIHFTAKNAIEKRTLTFGAYFNQEVDPDTYLIHAGSLATTVTGYVDYRQVTALSSTLSYVEDASGKYYVGSYQLWLNVEGQPELFTGSFKVKI